MPVPFSASDSGLTVAIVGGGMVARDHCRGLAGLAPAVRIVAIADIDQQRAGALAAAYGAQAYSDYRSALDLAPDIAVICLPHHLHREAGVYAAAAGCHILMEKPLAHSLEDAVAIVDACRKHQVLLAVGFVHRYRRELQLAFQFIADGRIGTPANALDSFCMQGGPVLPNWVWQQRQAGGGVLMYTGIHSIDRLRWLAGAEVTEVFARMSTYSQAVDVEDGLLAMLTFDNGFEAVLYENSPAYNVHKRNWDLELVGSRGRLRASPREYVELTTEQGVERFDTEADDPFATQASDFVAAVREQRAPWIGAEDGLRSLAVVHAIYRSAETRRAVALSDVLA